MKQSNWEMWLSIVVAIVILVLTGIKIAEATIASSDLEWLDKQIKEQQIESKDVQDKMTLCYIKDIEGTWAIKIKSESVDFIPLAFNDEVKCIESTLNDPFVKFISADNMYAVEKIHLSAKKLQVFEIVKDAGMFELTAYAWTGNRCANGKWPRKNQTVAAHKKQFPLGTKLYIEGYGFFIVEDRGGFPMGVIDVYLGEHMECVNFGRRKARVYVLEWGDNQRHKPEPRSKIQH